MKLVMLHNSTQAINNIMPQKISGDVARKIARIMQEVGPELQPFSIGRQKVFQEFGKEDDKGQLVIEQGTPAMKELSKYDEAEIKFELKDKDSPLAMV